MNKKTKNIAVHSAHCCKEHGCKYGGDLSGKLCPVETGEVKQTGHCDDCDDCDEKTKIDDLSDRRLLRQKLLVVINDLLRGTRHLIDHGHCGAKGRVLVSHRSIGGCEIVSKFCIRGEGMYYTIWHELITYNNSKAIGIMEAAVELCKIQEKTPSFTNDLVSDIQFELDCLLGHK